MDPPGGPKPDIGFTAPIGSVDLAAFDAAGEPYEIHACVCCLPWHAEVHIDDVGDVFVREWHAVGCEHFRELISAGGRPGSAGRG